jgi:hypothetical protein
MPGQMLVAERKQGRIVLLSGTRMIARDQPERLPGFERKPGSS